MTDADQVVILQVVTSSGRRVMDSTGNWRLFQVQDGPHEGARGTIRELTKKAGTLHWRYGVVIDEESGEVKARNEK